MDISIAISMGTLALTIITMWVNLNVSITKIGSNVDSLRESRINDKIEFKEYAKTSEEKFKYISESLTDIKLELKDKVNR